MSVRILKCLFDDCLYAVDVDRIDKTHTIIEVTPCDSPDGECRYLRVNDDPWVFKTLYIYSIDRDCILDGEDSSKIDALYNNYQQEEEYESRHQWSLKDARNFMNSLEERA